MITTDFLSGLDRFSLIIKKRVTSKYAGTRQSLATGRGSVLKDHRIYSWGDDFRLIDWKLYGRTDHLYVKQYEEERNLVVHVVIDRSGSMHYGSPTKFDYASMLGTGFAYLALKDNEKFQFATFSDTLEFFQPKRDMSHLLAMIDYLNGIKPRGVSKLGEPLAKYRKLMNSRSLVIVVSDFLYDLKDIRYGLLSLAGHDLKVVQVLDPQERHLGISGDVQLQDAESSSLLRTFISARTKALYERDMNAHIAALEKLCSELQAEFHVLTTDTPIFDAFYRILR